MRARNKQCSLLVTLSFLFLYSDSIQICIEKKLDLAVVIGLVISVQYIGGRENLYNQRFGTVALCVALFVWNFFQ